MKKLLTSTNMPKLNIFLGEHEEIKVLEPDIEYQEELFNKLAIHEPDVLLITDTLSGPFSKYELAEEILKLNKDMKIIWILKDPDDMTYIKFLKEKGLRHNFSAFDTDVNNDLLPAILFKDPGKVEVQKIVEEVAVSEEKQEQAYTSLDKIYVKKEVIAVASPGGGGIGKTTYSTNLAVLAAKKYPESKFVIVDYNDEKSDVAKVLNLPEEHKGLEGLIKAIKEEEFHTNNILKSLEPYDTSIPNLFILSGIKTLIESDTYNLSHYRYIIDTLKNEFDMVIIDTGAFKTNSTYAAIEKATKVIFMVRDSETSISSLKDKLDFYRKNLNISIDNKIEILMNMTIGYEQLNEIGVEGIFNKKPIANIAYNPEIAFCTEKYKPFVLVNNKKLKNEVKAIEKTLDSIFKFKYLEENKGLLGKIKDKVGL